MSQSKVTWSIRHLMPLTSLLQEWQESEPAHSQTHMHCKTSGNTNLFLYCHMYWLINETALVFETYLLKERCRRNTHQQAKATGQCRVDTRVKWHDRLNVSFWQICIFLWPSKHRNCYKQLPILNLFSKDYVKSSQFCFIKPKMTNLLQRTVDTVEHSQVKSRNLLAGVNWISN